MKKRVNKKSLIRKTTLKDFFGMSSKDVSLYFSKGCYLDFIYIVLNRDDLTRAEKKKYIYSLSITEEIKDNLWQRFCGDFWFKYCKNKFEGADCTAF